MSLVDIHGKPINKMDNTIEAFARDMNEALKEPAINRLFYADLESISYEQLFELMLETIDNAAQNIDVKQYTGFVGNCVVIGVMAATMAKKAMVELRTSDTPPTPPDQKSGI